MARLIAFYLPQYHPIPENDKWWGKGFTEWTNVAKAKPLYEGHYQPHVPADLGFYDLRVPETRAAQAAMAKEYGIEAFCYYHYWFAGKQILERPFDEILRSGDPDFPFCLCWANQTWTGVWHGSPNRVLIEQTYPGEEDHRAHFNTLLPAFLDRRYVTVDGKPLFLIYRPGEIPDVRRTMDLWRNMAAKAGLKGLHIVAVLHHKNVWIPENHGFDACVRSYLNPRREQWVSWRQPVKKIVLFYQQQRGIPTVYPYEKVMMDVFPDKAEHIKDYPCLLPNWDNTPRSGAEGVVLHGSTPELFRRQVRRALEFIEECDGEHQIIFIKSWNEWAEGNHLEPDLKYGKKYLEALREELGQTTAIKPRDAGSLSAVPTVSIDT
ncbi:MAG TPA: glycoside hydrolase family 99-like domain-containing protein [Nitrospirota bacterium]|nr:glycoside hydrolase family 99-like domain-containing protein [Nitrospirota bacterium]